MKAKRKIIYALLIVVLIITVLVFFTFPDDGGLGKFYSLAVLWALISRAVLYVGILWAFLRVAKILRNSLNISSLVLAMVNGFSGLLAAALFIFGKIDTGYLHHFLLNLLLAILIFADIVLFPKRLT